MDNCEIFIWLRSNLQSTRLFFSNSCMHQLCPSSPVTVPFAFSSPRFPTYTSPFGLLAACQFVRSVPRFRRAQSKSPYVLFVASWSSDLAYELIEDNASPRRSMHTRQAASALVVDLRALTNSSISKQCFRTASYLRSIARRDGRL